MLHTLRKLKAPIGRGLAAVLLLAWFAAALHPCLMMDSLAAPHMRGDVMNHDCCPPAAVKQAPETNCSAPGCAMQAVSQQQIDSLPLVRMGLLFAFALLLTLAWPRIAAYAQAFILSRVPPPHPHPTLAFCTLLI